MQAKDFQERFDVSRESMEKLELYYVLLCKWQKAINLVSSKTLDEAWGRHFADSAQLVALIPDHVKTVVDLGSGAGFPGLVLAILRPDLEMHLIESDERKCQFLKNVSRETMVSVRVHTQRIESGLEGVVPDLVVARALADLEGLLGFVLPWAEENPALECLFLKGLKAAQETVAARNVYDFDVAMHQSVSDDLAQVLALKNITRKNRA